MKVAFPIRRSWTGLIIPAQTMKPILSLEHGAIFTVYYFLLLLLILKHQMKQQVHK